MESRRSLDEELEDEDDSSDQDSSIVSEFDNDTSSNNEDENVAFLKMDRDFEHAWTVAFRRKTKDECQGPYEAIEGLMQPKVDLAKKKELMAKMLSPDLSTMEKEQYLGMLSEFPELFNMSYQEIKGFKGEDLHIEFREGVKLMWQRLRRMGQEQMATLKEEVDKVLSTGFIYPVETAEWVRLVVVAPKKDGKWRVCADFKPLNVATKKDPCPLPVIDQILDLVVMSGIASKTASHATFI